MSSSLVALSLDPRHISPSILSRSRLSRRHQAAAHHRVHRSGQTIAPASPGGSLVVTRVAPPATHSAAAEINSDELGQRSRSRERKMRLLTHNMLSSNIKGVTNGFPLRIEAEKVVQKEVALNPDFLRKMFAKIEWKALVDAAKSVGYSELPDEVDPPMLQSEDFLTKFHHALLELHLEEGALICPETGRRFPVAKGIPNMLLHEDEV